MPSQRAGRCFEGERERKLKIHNTEVFASVDALRYSRRGGNGKRDGCFCFPWLQLLLITRSSQAELEPIVRNDTLHTQRVSHWEVFTSCCCRIGINHNCLHCNNIDCILEECTNCLAMCERECVWGCFCLFIVQQMVRWCASHLVCVFGWFWIVAKGWDGKWKRLAELYQSACSRCVCVFCVRGWDQLTGHWGRQREINIGCSFSEMTNVSHRSLSLAESFHKLAPITHPIHRFQCSWVSLILMKEGECGKTSVYWWQALTWMDFKIILCIFSRCLGAHPSLSLWHTLSKLDMYSKYTKTAVTTVTYAYTFLAPNP